MLAVLVALTLLPAGASEETAQPLPAVQAHMLDGTPYSLADERGTIVLLAIWSPQSLASRKSIGELERFAAAYRTRGVNTIAASTTKDAQALREFVTQRGLSIPVAMLSEHNLGRLPQQRLPIIYVFDRNGHAHARHDGLYSAGVLERLVEPLLKQ
jgi:hypothetical protein